MQPAGAFGGSHRRRAPFNRPAGIFSPCILTGNHEGVIVMAMTPEDVRATRQRLGLTQRQLAAQWKISEATIYRYERDGAGPLVRDAFRGLAARVKKRKKTK